MNTLEPTLGNNVSLRAKLAFINNFLVFFLFSFWSVTMLLGSFGISTSSWEITKDYGGNCWYRNNFGIFPATSHASINIVNSFVGDVSVNVNKEKGSIAEVVILETSNPIRPTFTFRSVFFFFLYQFESLFHIMYIFFFTFFLAFPLSNQLVPI